MMSESEIIRRLEHIERKVSNGDFVRKEMLDLTINPLKEDIHEVKGLIQGDRRERIEDRRSLRNMVLGSVLTGIIAIVVAVLSAAIR